MKKYIKENIAAIHNTTVVIIINPPITNDFCSRKDIEQRNPMNEIIDIGIKYANRLRIKKPNPYFIPSVMIVGNSEIGGNIFSKL